MLKVFDILFFVLAWVLLGMGLALFFYRNHLCCDKDSDVWYYIDFAVISFILSWCCAIARKDKSE